jgi:hypothetical protein
VSYIDNNSGATYANWKTSVTNATCKACMFGKESASTWAPLLEDAAGELQRINVGGCIAVASGSVSCGRTYQNWFDCRFEACADCASSALQACLTAASKGACKNAIDAVTNTCGDTVITDAETACTGASYVFEGSIKALCVGSIQ